jgi:hypothetical protein
MTRNWSDPTLVSDLFFSLRVLQEWKVTPPPRVSNGMMPIVHFLQNQMKKIYIWHHPHKLQATAPAQAEEQSPKPPTD